MAPDVTGLEDIPTAVDADFHVTERQEDFIEYIEDPFHTMLFGGSGPQDNLGYTASFYPSAGLFVSGVATGKIQNPTVRTNEAVREGMAFLGMDAVHVDPTLNLYLGMVHHDELAAALANAYNAWVLDEIYDPDAGIYGPVTVAPQRPTRAAEEIDDRRDERAITSVYIPSGGIHPPLGNERYDPIYDAASRAGLPITLHSASGSQMTHFPLQYHGTNRYLSNHAPTHAMIHMMHLTDMITRGFPVRFPDLDVVFQESGLGWVPYMMRRLDNEYAEKRDDAPMLEQMPSEYVHDQFYFTSQPTEGLKDPEYITSTVNLLGPGNLMFSSDYPHLDFDHSDDLLRALRGSLDDDDLVAIYGGTATQVFDL